MQPFATTDMLGYSIFTLNIAHRSVHIIALLFGFARTDVLSDVIPRDGSGLGSVDASMMALVEVTIQSCDVLSLAIGLFIEVRFDRQRGHQSRTGWKPAVGSPAPEGRMPVECPCLTLLGWDHLFPWV